MNNRDLPSLISTIHNERSTSGVGQIQSGTKLASVYGTLKNTLKYTEYVPKVFTGAVNGAKVL